MFTLITREIWDHLVYFVGAAVFSAVFIVVSIPIVNKFESFQRRSPDPQEITLGIGAPVLAIVIIGICGLGVSQMYLDNSRKISAFLSTLAISRSRILIARILTGILVILTFLLPVAVTSAVLLRLYAPPVLINSGMYSGIVFKIFTVAFLMAFSCYCIGLQTGWTSGKVAPTLGGIVLACIFVSIIFIKGFNLQIVVILMLFIIASLIRIWHTFTTTSL